MRCGAVVVCVVLAVGAAGCGGGGDEDGGKAAYVAAAEAVCARANQAQQAEQVPVSPDGIAPYVRKVLTIAGAASRDLNALTPPGDDAADLRGKFLEPLERQVATGEEYAQRVEAADAKGDQAALLRLVGEAPTTSEVDLEYLRGYGFTACVDAADTSS